MKIDIIRQPERIDTRVALRVYGILAATGGWLLLDRGPVWLGVTPGGPLASEAAQVRVWGSAVVAAGCCAWGLATVNDGPARRRAFAWFIGAHAVVFAMLVLQRVAVWPPGLADWAIWTLEALIIGLVYVWLTADGEGELTPWTRMSLFEASSRTSRSAEESRHDQQVRDAAGREERNRLARDLHDSVKQQIFAIQTAAATAEARFSNDPAGSREAIGRVRESAREAASEMDALLDELRAVPREIAGLAAALRKQCDALGYRSGAAVTFDLGALPPADALEPSAYDAVFRVGQEALANVARHARATTVRVTLEARGGELQLIVHDDGAGFEPGRRPAGMGLANMRARADEIDATLDLTGQPGIGTTLRLSVPYATPEMLKGARRRVLRRAAFWSLVLLLGVWSVLVDREVPWAFGILGAIAVARYVVAYRRLNMVEALAK